MTKSGAEWYHALARYGSDKKRYWWNLDRSGIVADVLVPFASHHVTLVTRLGVPSLFNFSSVSYLQVFRTSDRLSRPAAGRVPKELSDKAFVEANNVAKEFIADLQASGATRSSQSFVQRALAPPKGTLFVILKVGDDQIDSLFDGVIVPVAKEFGLQAVRADRIETSGNITNEIVEEIAAARFVLADLTGERPNCYFEAGFAYAVGKEIIFSIQEDQKIHFDLAGHRFITWKTENAFRTALRARLRALTAKETSGS